mmetsp:Transcript_16338/g.18871  ORF Transcript_16338/g.18871 Transcript_16338/m.18871 type:complete len:80 (+) Transcript_16338:557-796(+)
MATPPPNLLQIHLRFHLQIKNQRKLILINKAEEAYLRMNKVLTQCNEILKNAKYFKSSRSDIKKLHFERIRRKLETMKD